jgi:XTP/dITP diphosphohydrolase
VTSDEKTKDEKRNSKIETRNSTLAANFQSRVSARGGSSLITRHSSLFLASSNPGKVREFREAAAVRGVTVETLPGFAELPACIEDGATFEENARKKAIYYSRNSPGLVFADDSGLCVDALGGAPGVYSARFAGPQATDKQNNQKLLAEIHQVEAGACTNRKSKVENGNSKLGVQVSNFDFPVSAASGNRAAHYICVIALAEAGQVLATVEGRADGVIIDEPKGAGGFGYDPYFYYPPLGKTFAEIAAEEKFEVSHRGEAFRKLLDYLCSRRQ